PLALDDPFAVVAVAAGPGVRLEDGGARLLELEEERIVVAGPEQRDRAGGPHPADANDLGDEVDRLGTLQQRRANVGQRLVVLPDELPDVIDRAIALARVKDERRRLFEPTGAADRLDELGKQMLGHRVRRRFGFPAPRREVKLRDLRRVDTLVPP